MYGHFSFDFPTFLRNHIQSNVHLETIVPLSGMLLISFSFDYSFKQLNCSKKKLIIHDGISNLFLIFLNVYV